MFFAAAAGATTSIGGLDDVLESHGLQSSRSLPLMTRAMSSRSSTSRSCDAALRSITSRRAVARLEARLRAQDARPAEHGVERRADLVRERGQKLVLQLRRFLGDAARALGRRDLAAQFALADDALGDVLDDGDRADDRRRRRRAARCARSAPSRRCRSTACFGRSGSRYLWKRCDRTCTSPASASR